MTVGKFIEYLQDLPEALAIRLTTPDGGCWEVEDIARFWTDPIVWVSLKEGKAPDPPLPQSSYGATMRPMEKDRHPERYREMKENVEIARERWLKEQAARDRK